MHEAFRVAPVLLAALLSACTVGPDYVRPAPPAAPAFDAAATAADAPLPAPDAPFWRGFGDPLLDALVEEALSANHDLRIALARHDRAEALLDEAGYDRLPTVTMAGQSQWSRASAIEAPGLARDERDGTTHSAAILAGWEIDFFGGVRRRIEARRAGLEAESADLAAAQVAVVGQLAGAYFELRGLQQRLDVARRNADNQRQTLQLVDAQLDAGRGTSFDVARATAQYESTQARVPALEAAVDVTMHRIAVLTGQPPKALDERLASAATTALLPPAIAADASGALLRRRPDVQAAERRLHAATARIGVATAALFPRFTLAGLLGIHAAAGDTLFGRDSETGQVAFGVDWSFLDTGRVRARIAAADADGEAALAAYEQAVLAALEETANALARYQRAGEEAGRLAESAQAAAQAAQLAHVRHDAGAADLLDVLDAERTRLLAEDAAAEATARRAIGAVAVYSALAGGWPQQPPARVRLESGRQAAVAP